MTKGYRLLENGRLIEIPMEEYLKDYIQSFLLTESKERPLYPHLGTEVIDVCYRTKNQIEIDEIRETLKRKINQFEPRISVDQITLDYQKNHPGRLNLSVEYSHAGSENSRRLEVGV